MSKKTRLEKSSGGWKLVRIRAEWVDMLRMAYKHNPAFSPDVDLTTMKEPQLIELACRSASGLISGWIWKQVDEWVQEIVQAERRDAIFTVANHLGAQVETHSDGTFTVIAPTVVAPREETPEITIQAECPAGSHPRPMFH